jgi:hypothetical protein
MHAFDDSYASIEQYIKQNTYKTAFRLSKLIFTEPAFHQVVKVIYGGYNVSYIANS